MLLYELTQDELISYCKKYIESLEFWLRRVIDFGLTNEYGNDYFEGSNENGQKIINNKIYNQVIKKFNTDKLKYNNKYINATTFDNLIDIICNPNFTRIFRPFFEITYPNGINEIRYFLTKLKNLRNKLYHIIPISIREAEQIICYTNDIIEGFKINYTKINMDKEYNVPSFIRFIDSFGNEKSLNESNRSYGGVNLSFHKDDRSFLRPGDIINIEVFVDPSFNDVEYKISWHHHGIRGDGNGNKISIKIKNEHVGEIFLIKCELISNKTWHKYLHYDDKIDFIYKVLPPIED